MKLPCELIIENVNEECKRLGINVDKKIILVLAVAIGDEFERLENRLSAIESKLKNARI